TTCAARSPRQSPPATTTTTWPRSPPCCASTSAASWQSPARATPSSTSLGACQLRPAPLAVRAEVDQEGQDDEEPLESGHVVSGSPVPKGGIAQSRPREEEEAEQR